MSKTNTATTPRWRHSIGTKRPVGPLQLSTGGDMVATPQEQSVSDSSGLISLKRCRLRASPATGLVGMQENAFLSDYFACLGFLPLASPSMVRQAMVNIMLGSMPQQRQERFRAGASGFAGGEQAAAPQHGQEGGWRQMLASQERTHYPSKCIFWCVIALGALVQGRSSEFVTRYLKLARASLTECFDEDTVETASAYLVMAFLHRFLGDQANDLKHLAFANSIVERLPQEEIPLGMENMLLAHGDESRFIHYGGNGSGVGVKVKGNPGYSSRTPKVKPFVRERDLCNFYFFAGQYMYKAFVEDILSERGFKDITEEGERSHEMGMEKEPSGSQEQRDCGEMEETVNWEGGGLRAPLRLGGFANESVKRRGSRDPPPAGAAMKTCIKDVLPEMASLLAVFESDLGHREQQGQRHMLGFVVVICHGPYMDERKTMTRPGTCSGVGSFVFHGIMGYMKAVKGEMRSSFKCMKVCAGVLMRFPGICRYRPHLAHAVLTAAASSKCRRVYDPVRDIYNSVLPWNGTPAPPMEEWGAADPICDHLFCRSLVADINDMDFVSNKLDIARARAAVTPAPTAPSSDLNTSSAT